MLMACNVEDFTARPVSLANPLPSVLKVRAHRFPRGRGCLGASQSSRDGPGRSSRAPLARPVGSADPIPKDRCKVGRCACDNDGIGTCKAEVADVRRIETMVTVDNDGVSATIALPVPVAPGRHPAVVIIDDGAEIDEPATWAARTYGSVTDETFERPEALLLEERET